MSLNRRKQLNERDVHFSNFVEEMRTIDLNFF